MRIAFVGTELGSLHDGNGALERVVRAWGHSAEATAGVESILLEGDTDPSVRAARLESAAPDLVVFNNRPLWGAGVASPVVHILHNYPDAWGAGCEDAAMVRRELERALVAAVSPSLARHVSSRFGLGEAVVEVRVPVEDAFLTAHWHGTGGPVLFPHRVLEKKGVRFFLRLAEELARGGESAVAFSYISPWETPTAEQERLLAEMRDCPGVTLASPPVSRSEMAARYVEAAVVVCPSLRPEGLSLVALEAQAVGTPIVTSGRGGLADATLAPNEIVAEMDVDLWAAAVERARLRAPDPRPSKEVARRHGTAAATASFLALVARPGRRKS